MPQADESFTILVCACGKRLKAPGAIPGRVGRCPACGGTLRAPAAPISRHDEPVPTPPPTDPSPSADVNPTRVGTAIRKPRKNRGAIGREGLVKVPKRSDPSLVANLRYPLWDGHGVSMLVFLPPVLWVTSCMSIGLVPWYVIGADLVMKMGALTMVGPMLVILTMAMGYVLAYLHGVIVLSAEGELYHPRVPSWKIGPTLSVLFKTLCAVMVGMLLSGPLMVMYSATRNEPFRLTDWIILGWLTAPGLAFALLALTSAVVQDNMMAANPLAILGAIGRVGRDAVKLMALVTVWAGINLTIGACLFRLPSFGVAATVIGVWLFWVLTVYGLMVVCRLAGLFVHENAKTLRWVPEESRWKV